MPLQDYRRKRHFDRTPEPQGQQTGGDAGHLYVIQKHAASRLHYDFRLELDGVLKSWAVPKGPSLNPAERRLAVHVEDHPVEYGSFEGVIPREEYGGGTVMLWDHGTWEPVGDPHAGYRRGRLKFKLHGRRLHGGWSLVRMNKNGDRESWLLIKEKDEHARTAGDRDILQEHTRSVTTRRTMEQIAGDPDRSRTRSDGGDQPASGSRSSGRKTVASGKKAATAPAGHSRSRAASAIEDPSKLRNARRAPLPAFIEPQLATLVKTVPTGDEWLHEMKFDGYRILAVIKNGSVRLITRREQDWTARFPRIAEAVSTLPLKEALLDGELVVLRPDGVSDFQLMQNVLKSGSRANLVYYLFDLPHCEGYDLRRTPLLERKEFLARILRNQPSQGPIRYSDHIAGEGATVYQHACRFALEGIISKRSDSPYESGRTHTWVKVKCLKRQEFVVGGYTDPTGSRPLFGALLLGYHDEQGRLRYCGKVGTGFNTKSIREIHKLLKAIEADRTPFANPPRGAQARGVHWVRPELVAEVEFTEWTDDGHLRHPSFQGLREDKTPREVVREEPETTPRENSDMPATKSRDRSHTPGRNASPARSSTRSTAVEVSIAGVKLSNPDRVLYPEQGLTKQELAEYYERVADRILPYVAGRPLTLVRCPVGHEGECFYQKHATGRLPPALREISIREKNATRKYLVLDDLAGLIALVQMGTLEIHTWGSRADDLERPDHLIFDLDPGPGVDWPEVIRAARLIREELSEWGLKCFVKTSGGKGLHVLTPITPGPGWDETKAFCKDVASTIAGREPDQFTAVMSKSRRTGRIFIDYLRNGRGATAVAPWSTRARPGAPISAPVGWNELSRIKSAAVYTVQNINKRLNTRSKDPWADFFDSRQSIADQE